MQSSMEKEAKNRGLLENLIETSPYLKKAYTLAKNAHEGQFRAEGTPYFTHCVEVTRILYEEWKITDIRKLAVGLLHDTIEDCEEMTLGELAKEFGPDVATWVDGVSKFRSDRGESNGQSKAERDRETVRKVFSKNLIDPFVGVAKLADRLHNMRTLGFMPAEKRIAKANETKGYAKLAESLGMWQVMRELENLSMKHSCPEEFEKYSRFLETDPRTREEFVGWLSSTLKTIAVDTAVDTKVETRLISLYKLKNKKGKDLTNKINDLVSFRIIVADTGATETRNNVYKVLGAVRENFAEIEDLDRFDDFYSKPKDNAYSAIQLTLEFPQGSTEVAITSQDKEEFNNWGVVSLIRKGDPELSKHALKLVFTKTQEVKFFSPKATGLDFAYSISGALGARADYVLINGVRHPISTVLPNGAEVEIELGRPRIAPREELRDYCLPATRRIINEQLSEQEKWNFGIKGREEVAKILSRRGLIDLSDLLKIDKHKSNLENLLFILGCKNSIEDLYYKVGSGVMEPHDLEGHFDSAKITKESLGLTSILIEGRDGPGITSLVSSAVSKLGGNIGPMDNIPHDGSEGKTFTLRMVIENLTGESEVALEKTFREDPRITKVIIV